MNPLQRFTSNARFGTMTLASLNFSVALNLAAGNRLLTAVICLGTLVIGRLAVKANQPSRPVPTPQEPRPEIPVSSEMEKRLQEAIASGVVAILVGGVIAWVL